MSDGSGENLLPSIERLLADAGALGRTKAIDTYALARQPVFVSDRWKESIAEFLRWSGTTLAPAGEGSIYDLVLGHGRVGAMAIYNAFRDYLRDRGGSLESAQAKLEALRAIPSMAAHWLRLIDWNLDDAERLEAADLRLSAQAVVRLPAQLSDRLKQIVAKDAGFATPSDFVEKAVEEKVDALESEDGGPPHAPKVGNGPVPPFSMGRVIRDLWRKPPRTEG